MDTAASVRRPADNLVRLRHTVQVATSNAGAGWPALGLAMLRPLAALLLVVGLVVAPTRADAECVFANGVVEGDEECDDDNEENGDACRDDCTWNRCGDGATCNLQTPGSACGTDGPTILEACDDGVETDKCNADCRAVACGDGYRNKSAGEACDDGNDQPGDGCEPDCTPTTDPQVDGLDDLVAASSREVHASFEDGLPTTLSFQVEVTTPDAEPVATALQFLTNYRELLRLTDPVAELFPTRIVTDEELPSVTFGQKVGGAPIVGAWITVRAHQGKVFGVDGRWYPEGELPSDSGPLFGARDAEATAQGIVDFLTGTVLLPGATTAAVYYDRGLFQGAGKRGTPRLAWRVVVRGDRRGDKQPTVADVYVDANTNEILDIADRARHARDFDLATANNSTSDTCWFWGDDDTQWFTEDGPTRAYRRLAGGNRDGDALWALTNSTYDYFSSRHQWPGFDGDDEQVEAFVHVGNGWQNASGGGTCLQFGTGWVQPDIFGHEYIHAIIDESSDLEYAWESGAVNEAFADYLGLAAAGFPGWALSGGLDGNGNPTVIRDMSDPPRFNQPDHYSDRVIPPGRDCCDDGGVHTNSGILNKAFYLMTDGGMHRGITVPAIGTASMVNYLFRTLTRRLGSSSNMADVRNQLENQIRGLGGPRPPAFFPDPIHLCSLRNAFASVGIRTETLDSDCDGTPDLEESDSDGDGIADSIDNCPTYRAISQVDRDGDGVGDACDPDGDDDGVCDFGGPLVAGTPGTPGLACASAGDCAGPLRPWYVGGLWFGTCQMPAGLCSFGCIAGRHPDSPGRDNCLLIANVTQDDADRDGVGDACEDTDGDGLLNAEDNCPGVANADQANLDADSLGDACDTDSDNDMVCDVGEDPPRCRAHPTGGDLCPNVWQDDQWFLNGDTVPPLYDRDRDGEQCSDPASPSSTNFGCGDPCDNCPDNYNPDQRDRDRDGLGDACDDDRDGDGIVNGEDNCPDRTNSHQVDLDGDGVGFGCDEDESLALVENTGSFFYGSITLPAPGDALRFPVPACIPPRCNPVQDPQQKRWISVATPIPAVARIVDDTGRTVADSGEASFTPTLSFRLHPSARYLPPWKPEDGDKSRDGGMGNEEPFVAKEYLLEIRPVGLDAVEGLPITLGLASHERGACTPEPVEDCRPALESGASPLSLSSSAKGGDRLSWKLERGAALDTTSLGGLLSEGSIAFCLYSEAGERALKLAEVVVPGGAECDAGKDCWKEVGGAGKRRIRFKDRRALFDGAASLVLRGGGDGESGLLLKAGGSGLRIGKLPVELPLRAQLQAPGGSCWQASYTEASVKVNRDGRFEASGD